MDNEEEVFEQEETRNALGYGFPQEEEKHNLISFFREIIRKEFNSKTANLDNDELGSAKIPVRTNLELAAYCKSMNMDAFSDVFMEDAQIVLATSLSKEGFLPKLAVTTQKFSETFLKKGLSNQQKKKGLFGKKAPEERNY